MAVVVAERHAQPRWWCAAGDAAVFPAQREHAVGGDEVESPTHVVHEMMVSQAQRHEVGEIGEPCEVPEQNVVRLASVKRSGAAVNRARAVDSTQGLPLRTRGRA